MKNLKQQLTKHNHRTYLMRVKNYEIIRPKAHSELELKITK